MKLELNYTKRYIKRYSKELTLVENKSWPSRSWWWWGGIQGCDGKRCRLIVDWLSLMRMWTWRWTSRWEGMTKVNWSLELAVEEEKRRWRRRLLATPGPSLVTASQLRTPSLHVAASPPFEIFPSAIVVILSSVSLGSEDINSVQKALDYNTCTIFIGRPKL